MALREANESLSRLLGPLITQAIGARRDETRRTQRIGEIQKSYLSLGLEEDKASALATLLTSGGAVPGSLIEDLSLQAHREEFETGLGLSPGETRGIRTTALRDLTTKQLVGRIESKVAGEAYTKKIQRFSELRELSPQGRGLMGLPPDLLSESIGIAKDLDVFSLPVDLQNQIFSGSAPAEETVNGVPISAWDSMETAIKGGIGSFDDLAIWTDPDTGETGLQMWMKIATGFNMKSAEDFNKFVGYKNSGMEILKIGQGQLRGQLGAMLRDVGMEEGTGVWTKQGKKRIEQFPHIEKFMMDNFYEDGTIILDRALTTGGKLYDEAMKAGDIRNMNANKQDNFFKAVDLFLSIPAVERNKEQWAQMLKTKYGLSARQVEMVFRMVDKYTPAAEGPPVSTKSILFGRPGEVTTGNKPEGTP